jgi:hypothetical protein
MKRGFILIFISLCFISCGEEEMPLGETEVFWVYSFPVPCDPKSNPVTLCLGVSYSEEFDFELAFSDRIPFEIEGYTFKPHYIQRLQVMRFEDSKTGKVTRKLIRIIAEERDYYDLLEGNWKVKRYLGEDLPNPSFPNGQSVNFLPGKRMALSSDGCNSISLQIKKVGPNRIISFGEGRSTLVACPPSLLIKPYPGLQEKFKREGNLLTFHNDFGEEVAVWEKMN